MSSCTVKLVKGVKGSPKKMAAALVGAPTPAFVLLDNGDDTCTVQGTDKAGQVVDISGVATITAVSDNLASLTVDPPTGMTFKMHAVGPLGLANVTVTATWTDPAAGIGPFVFVLPVTLTAGPANSIVVVPGIPTSH